VIFKTTAEDKERGGNSDVWWKTFTDERLQQDIAKSLISEKVQQQATN